MASVDAEVYQLAALASESHHTAKGAQECLSIYGHFVRVARDDGVVVRVASLVEYATQGAIGKENLGALVIKLDGENWFISFIERLSTFSKNLLRKFLDRFEPIVLRSNPTKTLHTILPNEKPSILPPISKILCIWISSPLVNMFTI